LSKDSALKRALFILGYPVIESQATLRFGDVHYEQTIAFFRPFFDEIGVVARTRTLQNPPSFACANLEEVGAKLRLQLPDFGANGRKGLINGLLFFSNYHLRQAFKKLVRQSSFIYVEAPSIESYYLRTIPQSSQTAVLMEMRGEIWLNRTYMKHRFGIKSMAYGMIYRFLFNSVRKRCTAGLYINQSFLNLYPVAGQMQATSDVYLPDDLKGAYKEFAVPARRFLYVGHLEKVKRVDLIICALNSVSNRLPSGWMFEIVGDGPEMPALMELARKWRLQSHIMFHGRVPWGEPMFRLYRNSDLFLMASTSEGASRALMEAMAFGLPSISTNVGSAPELLDPRVLVGVGNTKDYAQVIAAVATDPKLMTELSRENFQRSQNFRFSNIKQRREAFFRKIMDVDTRSRK
jgi:glycosyltransferase involved in cell wall biosynthesis